MNPLHQTPQEIQAAIDELRCSLSTILGMAESGAYNSMQQIALTARAGIARLELILPHQPQPKEDSTPCQYFRAQDCLAGCPRAACRAAGRCLQES